MSNFTDLVLIGVYRDLANHAAFVRGYDDFLVRSS